MTAEPPAGRSGLPDGSAPADGRAPRRTLPRWREQAIAAGWLMLIWNLLWGRFNLGTLIGGFVAALVVLLVFPLPPVTFGGRIRPGALLHLVLRFFVELVTASVHVAWTALRPAYVPRSAIIAIRLAVRTDLNLALTAELVSLVPATLIIEVDRPAGILYVHVFDVRTPQGLAQGRRRVREVERRLVRAIGSDPERRQLHSPSTQEGPSA